MTDLRRVWCGVERYLGGESSEPAGESQTSSTLTGEGTLPLGAAFAASVHRIERSLKSNKTCKEPLRLTISQDKAGPVLDTEVQCEESGAPCAVGSGVRGVGCTFFDHI